MNFLSIGTIALSLVSAALSLAVFLGMATKNDSVFDKDMRDAWALYKRLLNEVKGRIGGLPVFEPRDAREVRLYEILVIQNRLKRGYLDRHYSIVGE
jgi:hypothetical protein